MNGYDYFISDKSISLRVLLSSVGADNEKSLLSFFTPSCAERVYYLVHSSGGICPCADGVKYLAIFTSPFYPVVFAVRFDAANGYTGYDDLSSCNDPVIERFCKAFERAEHIADTFSLFQGDALIDANMLLSEFVQTRTVESNRIAASFGFAVVNSSTHVRLLISHIIFLSYLLDVRESLKVELANCGGILRATVYFDETLLESLAIIFPRVCGEENVVIRSDADGFAIEVIASIVDNSKIGLKSNIK